MNMTEILVQALESQKAGKFDAAKVLYLRVLESEPRNADANHLLGCILAREGKFDEAIASIGAAIAISPIQSTFYNSLGTCYKDKFEPVAAELCFRHALKLNQTYADAYSNLGSLLIHTKRPEVALELLQEAIRLVPAHESVLCNFAWANLELGYPVEALAAYQRAVDSFPSSAMALMGIAVSLNKLDRSEEAVEVVDRVLAMGSPFQENAFQVKGVALEALGRLDQACECYDAALKLNPTSPGFLLSRSSIRKVQREDGFFAQLQQLQRRPEAFHGFAKTQVFYALGKAYQDVGDIAQAAHCYATGASNQWLMSGYKEKDDIDTVSGIQECINSACLQGLQNQGSDSDRPIFIVGMPRSGTTLVEQIIGTHSKVTPVGELPYVNEVLDGLVLPGGWKVSSIGTHHLPPQATLRERAIEYLSRVEGFAKAAVGRRFTDKMPANYLNLGLILAMFPNARIIHCRRDPVDTCISCYCTLFAAKHYWSYDLATLGREYQRYWKMMQHWRNVVPGKFLEVRYEQVVDDTESAARQLLEWCNLEWEPQVLKFHETKRQVKTASVTQVRQPIYKSSVGRWKKWEPYIQPLLAEISDLERKYWAEIGQ